MVTIKSEQTIFKNDTFTRLWVVEAKFHIDTANIPLDFLAEKWVKFREQRF